MKTFKYTIILIFTVFLNNHLTSAQLVLKCAGKKHQIPVFKQNSVNSYGIDFEQYGILAPISQSKYDIELRAFYKTSNPLIGSAVIIKGDKEKLFAETYFYKMQGALSKPAPASDFIIIRKDNLLISYNVKSVQITDTLLNSLIKNKLFDLPNINSMIDSLSKNNIKVLKDSALDPYYMGFNLKINNQYRSFSCDPSLYYSNPNIKELRPERLLYDQFNQLYNVSGQERNHLFP